MIPTPTDFTEGLSRFASGVTVVTAVDPSGKAHGYTATAFSSVSLDPPLVLTCLSRRANCYPVFSETKSFCVNILSSDGEDFAKHFSTKRDDKFLDHEFVDGYGGIPCSPTALTVFGCDVEAIHPSGDHTILLGRVKDIVLGNGEPLLYYGRQFAALSMTDSAGTSR